MGELYELPDGWEWKQISDVLSDIKTGTTPPKKEQKYYDNATISWLSPSDFGEHKELSNSKNKINQIAITDKKAKIYQPNSLLLVAIGATVGKIGIIRSEASSNQQITAMMFKNNIDVDFSYYWFVRMKQKIIDSSSAATLPIINQTGIKSLPFPLPPLPEQQRIVSKLDLLFKKIDRSIALHQKNMDEADLFMGSVLNNVFGELEEKYPLKSIGSFSKVGTGVTPLKSRNDFYENGNKNWITSKATNNDYVYEAEHLITEIALNECRLKINPIGTIVVALYGQGKTRGQVSELMIETATNQALATILVDANQSINTYLKYFLKKSYIDIREKASGGTQPNLNLSIIKNIELPLPPLTIQQKVVKYLDEISKKIEKIKSVQKEKMASLTALKASILDRAFKGEL
ncbi:restriction endonuclease subunit S [Sulfurovum sp.]|uniref:restriction endonuclease subunit S n=1 Tax=Sulfurovum sp. TaxID=1969726 RepID=UPI0035670006